MLEKTYSDGNGHQKTQTKTILELISTTVQHGNTKVLSAREYKGVCWIHCCHHFAKTDFPCDAQMTVGSYDSAIEILAFFCILALVFKDIFEMTLF